MQVTKITRSKTNITGVKVYGSILGDSGKTYRFAYIRRTGFRGWICSCESFILRLFAIHRNCKHLRQVREQFGRYGTKIDQSVTA